MGTYALGIDVGTTYTAAAVADSGRVEPLTLGTRGFGVPTVLFVEATGEVVVGEAAERRALTDPERVVRWFKRRLGDPTPILIGGTPWPPELLLARMHHWVLTRAYEEQGAMPDRTVLTHPATWGGYRLEILEQAARQAGLPDVELVSEPVAAASYYASERMVQPGGVVAVYDLGGGTFDAALVRRTDAGFTLVGEPQGLDHVGGLDFDEVVLGIVSAALGDSWTSLDVDDPALASDLVELRRACNAAKESLSEETSAVVPVRLPNARMDVRITRPEFEERIRPLVLETTRTLQRAVDSAGVPSGDVQGVLLVGGSSRIPVAGEILTAELGWPIVADVNPKLTVARGAALHAAPAAATSAPAPVAPPPPPPTVAAPPPLVVPPAAPAGPAPGGRRWLVPVAALVVLAALVALVVVLRGGSKQQLASNNTSSSSPPATTASTSPSSSRPPSTAAGSTQVTHYLPFRLDGSLIPKVTFSSTGTCFTTSNVTTRTDAFRCNTDTNAADGQNLFDPCFLDENDFTHPVVACPTNGDATEVAKIALSQPPDTSSESSPSGDAPIWHFTLAGGAQCGAFSGMVPVVGDLDFNFSCDDGSFTTTPTGTGQIVVKRLDPNTNAVTTVALTAALN